MHSTCTYLSNHLLTWSAQFISCSVIYSTTARKQEILFNSSCTYTIYNYYIIIIEYMYVSIITILLTVEDGLVSFTNKCEQASYQKIKIFLQISNNAYRETNFKFIIYNMHSKSNSCTHTKYV